MSALRKARLALQENTHDDDGDDSDDGDDAAAHSNPFDGLEVEEIVVSTKPKQQQQQKQKQQTHQKQREQQPKLKKAKQPTQPTQHTATQVKVDAPVQVVVDEPLTADQAEPSLLASKPELLAEMSSASAAAASSSSSSTSSLLVHERFLNADAELRRLFGSATIDAANAERASRVHPLDQDRARAQLIQRRGAAPTARPSLAALRARAFLLVRVQSSWPRAEPAVSMQLVSTEGGVKFFKLHYHRAYRKLQRRFFACVNTGDPSAVFSVLRTEPFHMASLLQLANLSVRASDMPNASEYIERLLHAFECVRHPDFSFSDGSSRLLYVHEENRCVLHAIFRYVGLLGRRGAVRAAFEFSKLLLNLDPSDPLAILVLLDHYALRAKQFGALECIYRDAALSSHRLDMLVNFRFSTALAAFLRRRKVDGVAVDADEADALLQGALRRFPHAVVELLSRNGKPTDADQVLQNPVFALDTTHLPSLQHLVTLFAERNHDLWRSSDVVKWVLQNAAVVAGEAKTGALAAEEALVDDEYDGAYNRFAHLALSDFSDQIDQLPEDVAAQLRNGARMFHNFRAVGARRVRVDPKMTCIELFFRTLLMCWRLPPNAPARDADDDDDDSDSDDGDKDALGGDGDDGDDDGDDDE